MTTANTTANPTPRGGWKEQKKRARLFPLRFDDLDLIIYLRPASTASALALTNAPKDDRHPALQAMLFECACTEDGSPFFESVADVGDLPMVAYQGAIDKMFEMAGLAVKTPETEATTESHTPVAAEAPDSGNVSSGALCSASSTPSRSTADYSK